METVKDLCLAYLYLALGCSALVVAYGSVRHRAKDLALRERELARAEREDEGDEPNWRRATRPHPHE